MWLFLLLTIASVSQDEKKNGCKSTNLMAIFKHSNPTARRCVVDKHMDRN